MNKHKSVSISEHGFKRVQQRAGIHKAFVGRFVQSAFEQGTHLKDYKYHGERWCNPILYKGYIFIFKARTLITMLKAEDKNEKNID